MKLLFPLVATAFVGGAGASIYYSVTSGNEENKAKEKGDLSGEELEGPEIKVEKELEAPKQVPAAKGPKKEQRPEAKKEEKEPEEVEDIPDADRIASPADSERVEIIDGKQVRLVEKVIA